jgi:hypothetical protein
MFMPPGGQQLYCWFLAAFAALALMLSIVLMLMLQAQDRGAKVRAIAGQD